MNSEGIIKRIALSTLSENDQIKAVKKMAESEIQKDATNNLTREQQLEKALELAVKMLSFYMPKDEKQINVTFTYVNLVSKPKA